MFRHDELDLTIVKDLIKDRSALPTMALDAKHQFKKQEVIDTQKIENIIKAYGILDPGFGYN
jgi:hypothetical protein